MNRLPLCATLWATMLCSVAAAQSGFDDVTVSVRDVRDNVMYLEGRGGNIGLLIGEDGVIMIDDQFAPLTDRIVAAVATVSSAPIRFVINTHMHPDHTGGNENLGKLGAVIVGHDNVRTQMAIAGYDQAPPFVSFSESVTFNMNGETVRVFKVPNAHTNGDAFIRFDNANVIHTGDVFRTTGYPYIDVDNGGSFLGTIRAHDLLIDLADIDTKILPGHGSVSDVGVVRDTRDMLLSIRDRVQRAINEGMSLEQVQAAGLTQDFDAQYDTSNFATPERMLAAAYRELK